MKCKNVTFLYIKPLEPKPDFKYRKCKFFGNIRNKPKLRNEVQKCQFFVHKTIGAKTGFQVSKMQVFCNSRKKPKLRKEVKNVSFLYIKPLVFTIIPGEASFEKLLQNVKFWDKNLRSQIWCNIAIFYTRNQSDTILVITAIVYDLLGNRVWLL